MNQWFTPSSDANHDPASSPHIDNSHDDSECQPATPIYDEMVREFNTSHDADVPDAPEC